MKRHLHCLLGLILGMAAFWAGQGAYAAQAAAAYVAPAVLIPTPMQNPGDGYVLRALLLVTFFIHFVLVNIVLGSTLWATADIFKKSPPHEALFHNMGSMPTALALAVNFGVAPLLFAQVLYGVLLYSSSVLMALWWLAVPLLVMLCYYAFYIAKSGLPQSLPARRALLALSSLTLLFVAFLLVTNNSLMVRPEGWDAWLKKPGGNMLNLSDPTFAPRCLFVVFSALAVGGLLTSMRAAWRLRATSPAQDLPEIAGAKVRIGQGLYRFRLFLTLQFAAGLWLLFALPQPAGDLFTGGRALPMLALFGVTIFGGCAMLAARIYRVWAAAAFELLVLLVLVIMRDMARVATVKPYLRAKDLPLPIQQGQDGALVFFFLCAGLCTLLIALVLRKAFCALRAPATGEAGAAGDVEV